MPNREVIRLQFQILIILAAGMGLLELFYGQFLWALGMGSAALWFITGIRNLKQPEH